MRHQTHVAAGAVIVAPAALAVDNPIAGGAILLMGIAGAIIPDYVDLRSELKRVLRHRGVSHSVLAVAFSSIIAFLIFQSMAQLNDARVRLAPELVAPLSVAFGLGYCSHLLLDAMTPQGIRPFLPFSPWRLRLLPRRLRVATGGRIDRLIGATIVFLLLLLFAAKLVDAGRPWISQWEAR